MADGSRGKVTFKARSCNIFIRPSLGRSRLQLKVKVHYFAEVREITGLREETVDVSDSTTVTGLLGLLAARHGNTLREYLFDPETGRPRQYLQFLIDEKSISSMNGLSTRLTDGCTLAIIPPVGGG